VVPGSGLERVTKQFVSRLRSVERRDRQRIIITATAQIEVVTMRCQIFDVLGVR
jgi:hypothetical protein